MQYPPEYVPDFPPAYRSGKQILIIVRNQCKSE